MSRHGLGYSNYSFSTMAVTGAIKGGKGDAASGVLTVTVGVEDLAHYTPAGDTVVQVAGKSGNIFRVGIFLDFASLPTRTMHPHGAYV